MANIKVAVEKPIADGYKLKFRTPCDSTVIEGLEVKYPAQSGIGTLNKKFVFKDAHGTELSGVGNLFVSGVMIEVLLDVTHGVAYIQNADTNSYVESFKGEIKRLEDAQKQFLGVAGKVVEDCEKALVDTKAATAAASAVVGSVHQIATEAATAAAEDVATEFQKEIDKTNGRVDAAVAAEHERVDEALAELGETLDVERVRINELVAMRSEEGAITEEFAQGGGYNIKATITSNGINAHIALSILGSGYEAGETIEVNGIPDYFAPLSSFALATRSGDDIDANIYFRPADATHDYAYVQIRCEGSKVNGTYTAFYPLAKPFIKELADIRVGKHGNYETAGEAVRAETEIIQQGVEQVVEEHLVPLEEEVEKMKKNGTGGSRISYVDLPAAGWQGEQSPYSQVVAVEGATENSQVDLTPSVEQLTIFHNKDLAFVTENEDGVVTVYAIGQKPANDYTIQVTVTEVVR